MKMVYVVLAIHCGGDNVVGVFDSDEFTVDELRAVFNKDEFLVSRQEMANREEFDELK